MNERHLKERVKKFIEELGLPVTRFANGVSLSDDTIHKWLKHDLKLSEKNLINIDAYLKKYNSWDAILRKFRLADET